MAQISEEQMAAKNEISAKSCVKAISTTRLLFKSIIRLLRAALNNNMQFLGTWWLPSISLYFLNADEPDLIPPKVALFSDHCP